MSILGQRKKENGLFIDDSLSPFISVAGKVKKSLLEKSGFDNAFIA